MDVIRVHIVHRERYWSALRGDMPWLSDPDVDEGAQRHPDRDELDWEAIADAVENAGWRLSAGDLSVDEDGDEWLPIDVSRLEAKERVVVRSWFPPARGPKSDAGRERLIDGRHRLWNAWKARPDAVLPINSSVLGGVDEIPHVAGMAEALRIDIAEVLEAADYAVLERSPMYHRELRRWGGLPPEGHRDGG